MPRVTASEQIVSFLLGSLHVPSPPLHLEFCPFRFHHPKRPCPFQPSPQAPGCHTQQCSLSLQVIVGHPAGSRAGAVGGSRAAIPGMWVSSPRAAAESQSLGAPGPCHPLCPAGFQTPGTTWAGPLLRAGLRSTLQLATPPRPGVPKRRLSLD